MKFGNNGVCFLQMILSWYVIYTSSFSSSRGQTLVLGSKTIDDDNNICKPVEVKLCSKMYTSTIFPHAYGHTSWEDTSRQVNTILNSFSHNSSVIIAFVCTLYFPPCLHNNSDLLGVEGTMAKTPPLPCRQMCQLATDEGQRFLIPGGQMWQTKCQTLPTENCINLTGANRIALVEQSITAVPNRPLRSSITEFAPLDVELGNDEGYEFEVVTYSAKHIIPERRYDIANFGDPNFFQGWADVQGTGAANDYCRVVGRSKRRFLSCNLAGSTGQGHHYVSRLGFEPGYHHTWFMRDMDGDGRDDYCRCVGSKRNSRMTCMKAGQHGFYGSTTQGGDQHTFTLPNSRGCASRRYNPLFGEIIA